MSIKLDEDDASKLIRADVHVANIASISRTTARELIEQGAVTIDNHVCKKASQKVSLQSDVKIANLPKYVGRGGDKLDAALKRLHLSTASMTCADIGASTGGFTECMLNFGAKKVFAIDVGTNQLDPRLRNNEKVVSLEQTNVNTLTKENFSEPIDFIAVDVSFVSIIRIFKSVFSILKSDGEAIFLIKPQFEIGSQKSFKNGVIRDKKLHKKAIMDVYDAISQDGARPISIIKSALKGGEGNTEFFMYFDLKNKGLSRQDFLNQTEKVVYECDE